MANYVLWVANVAALQMSILFMYTRIFGISQVFRRVCYGFMAIIIGWTLAGIFSRIFACGSAIPKAQFFGNPMLKGTCVDVKGICTSIGLLHVILDLSGSSWSICN